MASSSRCGCRSPAVSAAVASSCISTSGGAGGGPSGGALALSPRRRDAPSCFMAGRAGAGRDTATTAGDAGSRQARLAAPCLNPPGPRDRAPSTTPSRLFPKRPKSSRVFPAALSRVFPPDARVFLSVAGVFPPVASRMRRRCWPAALRRGARPGLLPWGVAAVLPLPHVLEGLGARARLPSSLLSSTARLLVTAVPSVTGQVSGTTPC